MFLIRRFWKISLIIMLMILSGYSSGVSSIFDNVSNYLSFEIYRNSQPIDLLIVGDSAVWTGIDARVVEDELSKLLQRPATVVLVGGNWQGERESAYLLQDFLQRRKVKMVIFSIASPEGVLPKLVPNQSLSEYMQHRGSLLLNASGVVKDESPLFESGSWIYRWDSKSGYELNGVLNNSKSLRYLKRAFELTRTYNYKIAFLKMPQFCSGEAAKVSLPHELSDLKVPVLGIPIERLYPKPADPNDYFVDCLHANSRGAKYFSKAISPLLARLFFEAWSMDEVIGVNRDSLNFTRSLKAPVKVTNLSKGNARFKLLLAEPAVFEGELIPKLSSDRERALFLWREVSRLVNHWYPPSGDQDLHNPYLLTHGFGYGFCDDIASTMAQLARIHGFRSRVLNLNGHVVPEVFFDGKWNMLDPDHQLYFERNNKIASMQEIADKGVDAFQIHLLPAKKGRFRRDFWEAKRKWEEAPVYLEERSWPDYTELSPGSTFEVLPNNQLPIDELDDSSPPPKWPIRMAKISSKSRGKVFREIAAFPLMRVQMQVQNLGRKVSSCFFAIGNQVHDFKVAPGALVRFDSLKDVIEKSKSISPGYYVNCSEDSDMSFTSFHQMSPLFASGAFNFFASDSEGLSIQSN